MNRQFTEKYTLLIKFLKRIKLAVKELSEFNNEISCFIHPIGKTTKSHTQRDNFRKKILIYF